MFCFIGYLYMKLVVSFIFLGLKRNAFVPVCFVFYKFYTNLRKSLAIWNVIGCETP